MDLKMASEKDATCENDPNFAVVCAFFQKFTPILNVQHPDFKLLQEWLENTDEVAEGLKLLHIKLLRKLRKTVHESAWESALSKFCFGYSAQDAWEIERFGYKKSSLKVKLRVLKELVESQFQRNGKFRNTFSLMNADELRSQPIGRDKLGNAYWLTQDPNLNLRIYQEHLDEEIWQVVASSREELVTLINRLKGNEVVLPSLVGIVDEDTSSSNSCPFLVKPLPPEEKEENKEEIVKGITTSVETTTNNEGKVPNIKIKIERKSDVGCVKKDKTNENEDQSNNYEDGSEEEDEEEEEEDHKNDNAKSNDENKDQKVAVSRYLKRNKLKIENVKKANETVRNSLEKSTIQKGSNDEDNDKLNISETIGKSSIKEKAKDEEIKKTSDKSSLDEIKIEKRVKPIVISQSKNLKVDIGQQLTKKRSISAVIDELKNSNKEEESDLLCNTLVIKKPRPTLLDSAAMKKKVGKYEEYDEDEESEGEEEEEEEGEVEEEEEEEGDDEEEGEEEEEDDEGGEEGEEESDNIGDEIEEKPMIIKGVGDGEECESGNNFCNFFSHLHKLEDSDNVEVSEVIEEEIMIFKGEGYGEDCLVGNSKEEKQTDNSKFYFGQPGCLKLSPIKKKIEIDETKKIIIKSNESDDKPNNDNENKSSDKLVEDLKNGENEKKEQHEDISNEDKSIKLDSEAIPASIEVKNEENKEEKQGKIEKIILEKEQSPKESLLKKALEKTAENLKVEKNIENDKLNDETKPTKPDEKSILTNIPIAEEIKVTVVENCEKIINQKNEKQIISSPSEKLSSSNIYNDCSSKNKCGSSRKRRLSENVYEKQQQSYKQKSESETDINCDNQFDEIVDNLGSENEEEIVSGKRPKMRPKLINSDIRRKIEAKRNDIQQETSNSSSCSETEQRKLPRKPLLPKKLELKTSISIKSQKNVVDEDRELESKIKKDLEKKCDVNSGELKQSEKNIEGSQKAKSPDKLPQNKKVENDNQEVSERQNSYDNISSSNVTDKNKETVSDIKNENDKEADVKSQTKTTRSTRRSITEPLFQDLPQPKRKTRSAAGNSSGLRKNSTIKIEESPMNLTKVKQVVDTKVEIKINETDTHAISTQSGDLKSNVESVEGSHMPSVLETKQKEVESSTNSPLDCKGNETIKKENEETNDSQDQKIKNSTDADKLIPSLSEVVEQQDQSTPSAAIPKKKQQRRKREIDISNIIPENEIAPVRQSRRIAQLKIKEEAERRKLEEIALKKMKDDLKKKKKEESKLAGKPVEEVSEHSESSKEVDSEADVKKKVERKRKKRNGWSSCTESEGGEEDEDELIFDHHDYDRVSPFKSDHEFSPESELEDSSEVVPLKRARTARKEGECATEDDVKDDQACQKCGKKDHPEWILLCDKCDKGYHCSCLSPVLFIIPEGDWFCPPCQQEQLIIALENHLKEFDQLLEKKKEDEIKKEEALKAAQEAEEAKMARRNRNIQRQKNKQYSRQRDDYDDDDDDDSEVEEEEYGEGGDKSIEQRNERNDRIEKRKKKRKVRGRSYESTRRFSSRSSSKSFSTSSLSTESNSNSSSSQFGDSDDEPIYKLRKRRQINVSYRFNEFDDLINSAIKDEMDEVAGAGNLGRGKDISTIIEADKEEKLRQKQLQKEEAAKREFTTTESEIKTEKCSSKEEETPNTVSDQKEQSLLVTDDNKQQNEKIKVEDETLNDNNSESDFEPLKRKPKMSSRFLKKKKSRKLNSLDVSSEDDGSDEDFKTSSYETDEDEEESLSVPTESESSLEMYKKKKKSSRNKKPKKKKTRRAARRAAARNRNKQYEYDSDFVVDDSDDEEVVLKSKKKRKDDSDYTESLTDEDDDLSEDVDSDELCDDSTDSDESDGAWRPSKRKKQRTTNKKKLPPVLSTHKRPVLSGEGKHKKVKRKHDAEKSFRVNISKKNKIHDDDDDDDSVDGRGRKTRGKRFTYLEDYEEESSDDGIKPGVKRPDTPPEEREEFIRKQEEIKRMLAEKNTEAAKVVATPIPKTSNSEKHSAGEAVPVVETSDSLSTVPLSVIKGAKALDIDYLQRRGELQHESGDDQDTDFDDDLPDDFNPEDMDEEAIAKMMEEEDFAQQQLKLAGEVIQKKKAREIENLNRPPLPSQSDTESLNKISKPSHGSVLQEPPRKRLPIPTIQPPLIRNAPQSTILQNNLQVTASSRMEISNPSRTVPQQNIIVPPHKNISLLSSGNNSLLPSSPKDFRSPIPATVSSSPEPQMRPSTIQHQPNELEKPKGRRKKITPLRDTLQKQQAAAAAAAAAAVVTAAAATAAVKTSKEHQIPGKPIGIPEGSLLSIAQPPQLYKPSPNAQPSVITRMPQSPRARFEQSSRFYPPPSQLLHRMPQRLAGIPLSQHPSLRPSYATGPPPLRPVSNNGPPPPVSIDSGLIRHPPSIFGNPEQFSRTRQPLIHPPYRPPLYGTPGYPLAPPPQQIPSPQQAPASQVPPSSSSHKHPSPASQRQLPSTPQQPSTSPHHHQQTPPLHSPSPNNIHPVAGSYPVTSFTTGPGTYGSYYPPHSTPQQLTAPHSTPPPPTVTAVPSSVIVSAGSITVQQQQQQVAAVSISDTTIPSPPPPSTSVPPPSVLVTESRPKASTLETFNTKSNSSSLEAESTQSPYSSNEPVDDNDDEIDNGNTDVPTANATSEFSGLVSYFSSQQDDLDT